MAQKEEEVKLPQSWEITITIFTVIWILIGLAAFIHSLVCLPESKSGSAGEKIIGVLLAVLFGPFFYIYYGARKSYCRSKSNKSNNM